MSSLCNQLMKVLIVCASLHSNQTCGCLGRYNEIARESNGQFSSPAALGIIFGIIIGLLLLLHLVANSPEDQQLTSLIHSTTW